MWTPPFPTRDSKPATKAEKKKQKGFASVKDRIEMDVELSRMLSGVQLYREDGTLNLSGAEKVLNDPQYSIFREKQPELVNEIKSAYNQEALSQGLKIGDTIGKTAFALGQVREADQRRIPKPNYPTRKNNRDLLNFQYGQATGGRDAGMSARQRSLLEDNIARQSNANRRQLLEAGGGQSGAVQAGLQNMQQSINQQNSNLLQQDEMLRRQQQRRSDGLLSMITNDINRENTYAQNKFVQRDLPLYTVENEAKSRLMQAGLSNAFAGGTALANQLDAAVRLFGDRMPGMTVRGNSIYENPVFQLDPEKRLVSRMSQMIEPGTELANDLVALAKKTPPRIGVPAENRGPNYMDIARNLGSRSMEAYQARRNQEEAARRLGMNRRTGPSVEDMANELGNNPLNMPRTNRDYYGMRPPVNPQVYDRMGMEQRGPVSIQDMASGVYGDNTQTQPFDNLSNEELQYLMNQLNR